MTSLRGSNKAEKKWSTDSNDLNSFKNISQLIYCKLCHDISGNKNSKNHFDQQDIVNNRAHTTKV